MTPEDLLKQGNPTAALEAAKQGVRSAPADAKARVALFQLESLFGHWEKARTQLEVLAGLDAESSLLAYIFGPVIESEAVRAEVFHGKRTPIVFGEPEEWIGLLVQANQLIADGQAAAAEILRAQAFEAAPASAGAVNGEACEWLADSDSRLGPVLEVITDGCYRWVPFSRIATIDLEPPKDLRDLIWANARFTWTNGGNAAGFIPVRYPGSEAATDPALQLARRTEWTEQAGGTFLGIGQRLLCSEGREFPLLEVRSVHLNAAPLPASGQDG